MGHLDTGSLGNEHAHPRPPDVAFDHEELSGLRVAFHVDSREALVVETLEQRASCRADLGIIINFREGSAASQARPLTNLVSDTLCDDSLVFGNERVVGVHGVIAAPDPFLHGEAVAPVLTAFIGSRERGPVVHTEHFDAGEVILALALEVGLQNVGASQFVSSALKIIEVLDTSRPRYLDAVRIGVYGEWSLAQRAIDRKRPRVCRVEQRREFIAMPRNESDGCISRGHQDRTILRCESSETLE